MKYGPDDEFWVVIDPTPDSEIGDVMFKTSLKGLLQQFRGGLEMARNPTIFTKRKEAEIEAFGRLAVMRAFKRLTKQGNRKLLRDGVRLVVFDEANQVLFEEDLNKIGEDDG